MCLINEKSIDVKACYGYALQLKVYDDLHLQLYNIQRYRGIFNGNAIPIMEEIKASHLRTLPRDAGFYGFNKLSDARKYYRKYTKSQPFYNTNRIAIVLCEFRDIFEIGSPNIYGSPRLYLLLGESKLWEKKITAFRARYRRILCEVPITKPKKERKTK